MTKLKEPERVCYECKYLRSFDEGAKIKVLCGLPGFGTTKQMKKCERCGEEITGSEFQPNCPRCWADLYFSETEFIFPYGETPHCNRFEEKPPKLEELRDAIRELQLDLKGKVEQMKKECRKDEMLYWG